MLKNLTIRNVVKIFCVFLFVISTTAHSQSGALVRQTVGGQVLYSGIGNKVVFNTVVYDNLGFFDPAEPTRLTIPKGVKRAKFVFSSEAGFSVNKYNLKISVLKNGSNGINEAGLGAVLSGAGYNPQISGASAWIPVEEGDYFEMSVWSSIQSWLSDYIWLAVEFESD